MKRVLHLRSSGDFLGAESVIIEIAMNSKIFGYDGVVGVIKNIADPTPLFLNLAKDYHLETVVFECRGSFDPFLSWRIRRYIKETRVKILHCHGYKEDFYGLLTPVGIPKIATNHLWKRGTTKSKLYSIIDAQVLRFFDCVIGVSGEIVDEMRNIGIKNPVKIVNGVNVDRFYVSKPMDEFHQSLGIRPDQIVIGMISSLTKEKGHFLAIEALKSLISNFPDLKLLIVGDGKLRAEIEKQVKYHNLSDNILFLGRRKDIPEILSIIDIFLLPSFAEGLPIALLEAMAAGKAVITTRVGENSQIVTPFKTGILIDPGNLLQLKDALFGLIGDRGLRKRLGENAHKEIIQNYSSYIMTKRYCDIYNTWSI